jgi:site-specific DNA-methyltransferase (adenine-specific)
MDFKPYYQHGGITIYNADCRLVLPTLPKCDLLLTDPPYPDYFAEEYHYYEGILNSLQDVDSRQLIFWSAKADFPLDYTAIHIWDKKTGCGSEYERIFERNGQKNWKVYRHYLMNSTVAASFGGDIFNGHPSQKPIRLLRELLTNSDARSVLDPFLGSGTTLVAAKAMGLTGVGIELHEPYAEIAAKRLAQEVFDFG